MHGSNQSDGDEELEFRECGGERRWWCWEAARFETTEEERLFVGFVREECEEEGEDGEEDKGPLGPAPGFPHGYEGANYGTGGMLVEMFVRWRKGR